MKREKFLREVASMCGHSESRAIRELAEISRDDRRDAAREIGRQAWDDGLSPFLVALIDIDERLVDDLAAMLPKSGESEEAEQLLRRLWDRLVAMITPEAREVLYAHNQLRLMMDIKAGGEQEQPVSALGESYQRVVETARAALAATEGDEAESTEQQQGGGEVKPDGKTGA